MTHRNHHYVFRLFYLIAGLLAGALFVFLPVKYAFVIVAGAAFCVFSFFQPKLSYMLFFFGMLVIPYDYWNNLLILLSAVFYSGLFALQWFMDKRRGLDLNYLAPSLVLFVFFGIISTATGFGGSDSIRVFAILLGCIIHSVLIIHYIETKEELRRLILILSIALMLTSLFGLYQYMAGIEIKAEFTDLAQSQGLSRLFSTMANSNNDAEVWVMLIPFAIAMIINTKSDGKRLVLTGITLVCILALMLTYSRSGYLALLAAAGVFMLMASPRLVPVGILAFIIIIPFLPQSLIDRVMTIGKDTSSKYRLYIWEGVIRMLKDFWIPGIGMGPAAFTSIYRGYANTNARPAMHSHNVFLSVLVETGIGGFLSFMAFLLRVFKSGISAHIRSMDKEFRNFTAAAIASLTAFCVFGLVEYVWFYPRVMLVFWLVSGIALSLYRMGDKSKEKNGNV